MYCVGKGFPQQEDKEIIQQVPPRLIFPLSHYIIDEDS